ncbi:hypothetical protein LZ31DRAFT_560837 [Colletotrichum somersetense]|nr:hypothetical protein LZ31DRAFT_560837 [Colletotrichum somersetense]
MRRDAQQSTIHVIPTTTTERPVSKWKQPSQNCLSCHLLLFLLVIIVIVMAPIDEVW